MKFKPIIHPPRRLFLCLIAAAFGLLYLSDRIANKRKDSTSFQSLKKLYETCGNKTVYTVLDWTASARDFNVWYEPYDEVIHCKDNIVIIYTTSHSELDFANIVSFHLFHMPKYLPRIRKNNGSRQYTLAYTRESEMNSPRRHHWGEMDFNMWCNFDRSHPAPLTYFPNVKKYLKFLLAPPVPFNEKNDVPVLWACSNCAARNGRYLLVKELMKYVRIDSIGKCLRNINTIPMNSERTENAAIYKHYKFVIVIENSNCEDYVTEKLVQAFESGSVPIVASYDKKPNYLRFAPRNSFINVYDFLSVKDLGDFIIHLSKNQTLYENFIYFRLSSEHNYNLEEMSENEILRLAKHRMGNQMFFEELLREEVNENMYCTVAKYLKDHQNVLPVTAFHPFPEPSEVCLPIMHLSKFFNL